MVAEKDHPDAKHQQHQCQAERHARAERRAGGWHLHAPCPGREVSDRAIARNRELMSSPTRRARTSSIWNPICPARKSNSISPRCRVSPEKIFFWIDVLLIAS